MNTNNLCFEQKYEEYPNFLSESFHFLVVKISVFLNRRVFLCVCVFFCCFFFVMAMWRPLNFSLYFTEVPFIFSAIANIMISEKKKMRVTDEALLAETS